MLLKELVKAFDKLFCARFAIGGDNVGLQIGKPDQQIDKVLLTVDITGDVINEALSERAGLIFSHHPLIFLPVLNITGESISGSKILKLIENEVSVYVAHTNYDLMPGGVNDLIAEKIGLVDIEILDYIPEQWYKFVIFVPEDHESEIRKIICENGGGRLGNYSCCTFNIKGRGTFKPLNGAKPYTGQVGKLSLVDEIRIECVVSEQEVTNLVDKVLDAHPYEEPAFDLYNIENKLGNYGIGRIGRLNREVRFRSLMDDLKSLLALKNLKWMAPDDGVQDKEIRKIAIINGSANSAVPVMMDAGFTCDMVIAGELKYHNALSLAEKGMIVVEIGHGESERVAIDGIYSILKDSLDELEIIKSKTGFKPWRYHIE